MRVILLLFIALPAFAGAANFTKGPDTSGILGGIRITGFIVGSFSYNSHLQMVPEFAGGVPALADPGKTNFRFDKFGIGFNRSFASWLSASAALEVESHIDRHSHGFDPEFGCPGNGPCVERFGAEPAETQVNLDKFAVNVTAPIGNGLTLSLGRFDVPFGIERHDEILLLTATTSEVFRYGRPNKMTGFQANYVFGPDFDVNFWVVNRGESETTHDDFNDNNGSKSVGGRLGWTPLHGDSLLNIGIGTFTGKESTNDGHHSLLDIDMTYNPSDTTLFSTEFVVGKESQVSLRKRGLPYPDPAITNEDVSWTGFYLLAHQDFHDWFGVSGRYGWFDDDKGARTGVRQILQSFTFGPILHLSRLAPGLRPTGVSYSRTRHPIDWVDLKLEYRFNHSNRGVFSDAEPAIDILEAEKSSHQFQAQLVANF